MHVNIYIYLLVIVSVEQLGNACTMYHMCLPIFAFKCRADCMCTSHKSSGGS